MWTTRCPRGGEHVTDVCGALTYCRKCGAIVIPVVTLPATIE